MFGLEAIGMPLGMLRERVERAARDGNPRAKLMLKGMDNTRAARAFPGPVVRPPRATALVATEAPWCEDCGKDIGGRDPCSCHAPPAPLSPGAQPFAAEAERLVPNGWARARAALVARETTPARDALARNGAGPLFVCGPITADSAFFFLRQMDTFRALGARALLVGVRSSGGDARGGFAMIHAMQRASREGICTIAHVEHAGSMAGAVAVAADYAVADPLGQFFLHEPSGGEAAHVEHFRAELVKLYQGRTLMDPAAVAGWMAGAVTLDAGAAHQYGFVDEVAPPARVAEVARAATTGGLWNETIRAANSWRRHVLREPRAAAEVAARGRG
jgi:ATP-dependent protease ClpP protease subunit